MNSAPLPVYYREADLVVSNLVVQSTAPHSGDTIPVTWTVTNQGTRNTRVSTWYDGVYLSPNPSLDPNQAIFLGEFIHFGALNIGSSYTETQSVTLPYGISGNYYLLVFVDDNRITQAIKGPATCWNIRTRATTSPPYRCRCCRPLCPTCRSRRSLRRSRLPRIKRSPSAWTVTNTSPAPTLPGQTTWNDLVYLSVDQYLDLNSDIYLGTVKHTGSLAGDGDR